MSNVKIKLNHAGMREMLKSLEVRAAIKEEADKIASRCGEGYVATATVGSKRALAAVRPDTPEAIHDNYENNTLLKAVR